MDSSLALESRKVAGLPLVNAVLDRLGFDRLLQKALPAGGRLDAAQALTGSSYYTWRGADISFGDLGSSGVLSFAFRLAAPGKFHVRFHNRHAHPVRRTQDYISWCIRLDGGPWRKTFSGPPREHWKWDTGFDVTGHPPAVVELRVGFHSLDIGPLHEGVSLDRIHLCRDGVAGATRRTRPLCPARPAGREGAARSVARPDPEGRAVEARERRRPGGP